MFSIQLVTCCWGVVLSWRIRLLFKFQFKYMMEVHNYACCRIRNDLFWKCMAGNSVLVGHSSPDPRQYCESQRQALELICSVHSVPRNMLRTSSQRRSKERGTAHCSVSYFSLLWSTWLQRPRQCPSYIFL